ncbi:MAG: M12 family metallopeptidase [Phycisphaerae bacterium]|jgi:hypothetical protein
MRYLIFILAALIIGCNSTPRLWPDGEIPFVPVGFDADTLRQLEKNMLAWEFASRGRVKFINKLYHPNYENRDGIDTLLILRMHTEGDKSASVSYGYNNNMIAFIDWFAEDRAMLHELGHVVGLPHEHQRPDRDLYIKVDTSGVGIKIIAQMIYEESNTYNYREYLYDIKSIMHYDVIDSGGAIVAPNDCGGETISPIDAIKVFDMYDNPGL